MGLFGPSFADVWQSGAESQGTIVGIRVRQKSDDESTITHEEYAVEVGPELLGIRQTGLAAFRVADLARDAHLLPSVQQAADEVLEGGSALAERLVARWVGGGARYAGA